MVATVTNEDFTLGRRQPPAVGMIVYTDSVDRPGVITEITKIEFEHWYDGREVPVNFRVRVRWSGSARSVERGTRGLFSLDARIDHFARELEHMQRARGEL